MSQPIQCENCGAVLLQEDVFCGECGAPFSTPRPGADAPPTPQAAPPPQRPPAPRPPQSSSNTAWRVAAIVLVIVGAIMCILGLSAFLIFGLTESEVATPTENWLYATFCCLLPIAGSGGILALAAAGIWYSRLRDRQTP